MYFSDKRGWANTQLFFIVPGFQRFHMLSEDMITLYSQFWLHYVGSKEDKVLKSTD